MKNEFEKPREEPKSRERDRDSDKEGGGFRRRRPRPPTDLHIDYKDIETLRPFLTETGAIVPSRLSRLNRKQQRELTQAVKRARQLALVPIASRHAK